MAIPLIPLAGLGLCGYAVWRAFRAGPRFTPDASNNWQNENFATFEETGTFAEGPDTTFHQNVPLTGAGAGSGGCG